MTQSPTTTTPTIVILIKEVAGSGFYALPGYNMKKLLKKANRGILLTLAILAAVSVYLIVSAFSQAAEKPVIEQVCRDYIDTEISYTMLPDPWRLNTEPVPEEEFESYIAQMKNEIAPWYIANDRIRELALNRLESELKAQTDGSGRIMEYTKEISRFESFSFSGNEVTVVFKSRTAVERNKSEHDEGGRIVEETSDTIMLQKEDGEWKLIYATLYHPTPKHAAYENTVSFR